MLRVITDATSGVKLCEPSTRYRLSGQVVDWRIPHSIVRQVYEPLPELISGTGFLRTQSRNWSQNSLAYRSSPVFQYASARVRQWKKRLMAYVHSR